MSLAKTRSPQEDRERALPLLNVSRETIGRLDLYVALLLKWQKAINLVAPSTLGTVWTRHILDSAQIAALGPEHRNWSDLGSGAGLPGLIIAILSSERGSESEVHLVESDQRKASFLREAARVTKAPAIVHAFRIEDAIDGLIGRVTAVTARALAPLPKLLELAEPLLTKGIEGFFPKGQALESELEQASILFDFEARLAASRTDKNGRIVIIRKLRRRAASIGG
ncbi:MAG: 16S rRNA (guanine(527)-N(7))-methyltransferase RsmG [Hyphomicrobiales bacterium]